MEHNQLEVFVGKLTQAETISLFEIVASALPNEILLGALGDILSDGDKEELMARWEEKEKK